MPKSKTPRRRRTEKHAVKPALRKPVFGARTSTCQLRQAQRPAGGRPKLFPGKTGGR